MWRRTCVEFITRYLSWRDIPFPAALAAGSWRLLGTKRFDWMHLRGVARRHVAGEQRYSEEHAGTATYVSGSAPLMP